MRNTNIILTRRLTLTQARLIDAADHAQAVITATGITEDGGHEVLALMVGDSETEVFTRAAPASAASCRSTGATAFTDRPWPRRAHT
ncbi:hypothetical protein [Streptomyces sp. NPDC052015]|uniref:hypothetical protein n=1 Tax=Streptomyces sp. NPDC052015 TaxID=3154755 RepID=UPI00344130E9